jgi:hypothetical protein
MHRILTAAAIFALAGTSTSLAQAITPITPESQPPNLLADIYVSEAIINYCKLDVEKAVLDKMVLHAKDLQIQMRIDDATAKKSYDEFVATIKAAAPDCKEGSAPLKTVAEITARYKAAQPPASQ